MKPKLLLITLLCPAVAFAQVAAPSAPPASATLPAPSPTNTAKADQEKAKAAQSASKTTEMPDISRIVPKPIDCGTSIIKLAPKPLSEIADVCPIINAALPIFAKVDLTKVAGEIPYQEDDDKFYVPLLTSAVARKGRPILITFKDIRMVTDDFYTIGKKSGTKPKLGVALEYIKANGGSVIVAPTEISDAKNGNNVPWIASIISFIVKKIQGNSMKGLKKYDVIFFVAKGGDLYQTQIDHICFNPKGSGIVDCLDAKLK